MKFSKILIYLFLLLTIAGAGFIPSYAEEETDEDVPAWDDEYWYRAESEDDQTYNVEGGIYTTKEVWERLREDREDLAKSYKTQKNQIIVNEFDRVMQMKVYVLENVKKKIYSAHWLEYRVWNRYTNVRDKSYKKDALLSSPPDSEGPMSLFYEELYNGEQYVYAVRANGLYAKFLTKRGVREGDNIKEIFNYYKHAEQIGNQVFVKDFGMIFDISDGIVINVSLYDDQVFDQKYNVSLQKEQYN